MPNQQKEFPMSSYCLPQVVDADLDALEASDWKRAAIEIEEHIKTLDQLGLLAQIKRELEKRHYDAFVFFDGQDDDQVEIYARAQINGQWKRLERYGDKLEHLFDEIVHLNRKSWFIYSPHQYEPEDFDSPYIDEEQCDVVDLSWIESMKLQLLEDKPEWISNNQAIALEDKMQCNNDYSPTKKSNHKTKPRL